MRVVKDPDERKQEILDAAIHVFARKGLMLPLFSV